MNTTTTPTGAAALGVLDFDRVINSRFVTTRDEQPIHCFACDDVLAMGASFSTVKGSHWTQWCAQCAVSFPALVGRFYTRLVAEAKDTFGTEIPEGVREAVIGARGAGLQVAAEPDDQGAFLRAYGWLITARIAIDTVNHAAVVAALSNDPLFTGLALAADLLPKGTKHQQAAESIAAQWERKGSISGAQRGYAENLGDMARKVEAKQHAPAAWAVELHDAIVASGVDDGYYAVAAVAGDNDLSFARIGTTDQGQRFMRRIVGGDTESNDHLAPRKVEVRAAPSLDWCKAMLDAIKLDATGAAQAYGRNIGRCGLCHRRLTDKASREQGIGPVCIRAL